jgi:hypothetical protein
MDANDEGSSSSNKKRSRSPTDMNDYTIKIEDSAVVREIVKEKRMKLEIVKWTCSKCTFLNETTRKACEMCDTVDERRK